MGSSCVLFSTGRYLKFKIFHKQWPLERCICFPASWQKLVPHNCHWVDSYCMFLKLWNTPTVKELGYAKADRRRGNERHIGSRRKIYELYTRSGSVLCAFTYVLSFDFRSNLVNQTLLSFYRWWKQGQNNVWHTSVHIFNRQRVPLCDSEYSVFLHDTIAASPYTKDWTQCAHTVLCSKAV